MRCLYRPIYSKMQRGFPTARQEWSLFETLVCARQNKGRDLCFASSLLAFRHEPGLTGVTTTLHSGVIKTFADKLTKELYESGKLKRFPPGIWERALRKLEYLDLATSVTDLKVLPSNRLHKLERDRAGQYSISVNDQWRVCFRFEKGDAYDVVITDYH